MVTVVLLVVMTVAAAFGMNSITNSKMKSSVTLVSVAIRSAFTRASAHARPVRVVFDFKARRLWLEEGTAPMLVRDQDPLQTGGADPATEAEKAAAEQAERILKGPRAPRTTFQPIKTPGFAVEAGNHGRVLDGRVYFREINVAHQSEPAKNTGRSYLYFWPGGLTELAYIQLSQSESLLDADNRTLVVHPITGKVRILPGLKTIPIQGASDTGEREDPGGF